MTTTAEIFDSAQSMLATTPHVALPNVCYLCLGAADADFAQCADCWKLFLSNSTCPPSMRGRVVPMTIAVNPGLWYRALLTYKKGQFREYAHVVAAVAYEWLKRHAADLNGLLGGQADIVTIVPSKRGHSYDSQPLRKALALVPKFGQRLSEALACAHPDLYGRMLYAPEMFRVVTPAALPGSRVLLIEDSWITGATALSAAGALLAAGANDVVVVPIAREISSSFRGADHPYLSYLKTPYDLAAWPRN